MSRGSLWVRVQGSLIDEGALSVVLKQDSAVGRQGRAARCVGPGGAYGFPGGAILPVLVGAGHVAGQTVRVP